MFRIENHMKRYKCITLFLVVLLITFIPINAMAAETTIALKIPEGATKFVSENYKDIVEVVKDYKNEFNVSSYDLNNITLGKPYVIYNLDETQQDEIYYYPILNSNSEIILTLCITGTTEGWGLSISEEMSDELNSINYLSEEFIFYESADNIVAENSRGIINLSGKANEKCRVYEAKDFKEKRKIIADAISTFVKTDISKIKDLDINRKDKYTPSFSESTTTSKICSLHNNKGQGSYANCWAAAVATIVNYRNGTNITPTAVCDSLGISYNDGGGIGESQLALSGYDVSYNNLNYYQLPWSSVTSNLDYKYPIYISAYSSSGDGHAVTVYGYRMIGTSQYVVLWNSGLNGGVGGTQIVYYYSTGTTFPYSNTTFIWSRSLSCFG